MHMHAAKTLKRYATLIEKPMHLEGSVVGIMDCMGVLWVELVGVTVVAGLSRELYCLFLSSCRQNSHFTVQVFQAVGGGESEGMRCEVWGWGMD